MVIKNSTPWDSTDIRKLFRRCAKEVDKVEQPRYPFHRKNKSFELDVLNSSQCRGRATVGGYWIMIKIPRDWALKDELEFDNKQELARLIIHEYYHSIGVTSIDRRNYRCDVSRNWDVDWVNDYPIRKKQIIDKPKTDIRMLRYQRALVNYRKAETRLKRAKTLYGKWKQKIKYYEEKYNYKSN